MGLHTKPVFGVAFSISIEMIYSQIIYVWKDMDVYFLDQKTEIQFGALILEF